VGSQPTADEMEGKVIEAEVTAVAQQERPAITQELPEYPAAEFDKNLGKWGEVIESGRKSAADIIAMVSTKATLSEDQKARIFDYAPPADDTAEGDA